VDLETEEGEADMETEEEADSEAEEMTLVEEALGVVAVAALASKAAADSTTIILMGLDLHLEDRVVSAVLQEEGSVVLVVDQVDREGVHMVHPLEGSVVAEAVGIAETSNAKVQVDTMTGIRNGLDISLRLFHS